MHVVPGSEDWRLARELHGAYSAKPGAQHIATEFALAHLSAVVDVARPMRVLEFGAGIGTMTHMLLAHPAGIAEVVSSEPDRFCQEQLARNIPDALKPRLTVLSDAQQLQEHDGDFELVVFDGDFAEPSRHRFLRPGTVCFVEGARQSTRKALAAALARQNLQCRFTAHDRGPAPMRIVWRRASFGIRYPKLKTNARLKGCWIGRVHPLERNQGWYSWVDSNHRPSDPQSDALTN